MNFLEKLLSFYSLNIKDLKERTSSGSFSLLKRPYDLPAFLDTTERIKKALEKKEKVVIYGDYDVDGLCSTAILKNCLDRLGITNGYFIPSRYVDGYGLTKNRVEQFIEKGYQLIITVDNGVGQSAAIDFALKNGLDVIVIDHHEIETEYSFPHLFHQRNSLFLDYNCSAASLSYFVYSYFYGDDCYLATLAGLAVFSDVMPLVRNNLIFAKLAVKHLNNYSYQNLLSLTLKRPVDYEAINFDINSKLNAVNRVNKDVMSTNRIMHYLLSPEMDEKRKSELHIIEQANAMKKNIYQELHKKDVMESKHALTYVIDDYNGMAGYFAIKSLNEVKKSVSVFAPDSQDNSLLIGSIRACEGYDLLPVLSSIQSFALKAGGHKRACGVTIKKADYFRFATLFSQVIEKEALFVSAQDNDAIRIDLDDLSSTNYETLLSFAPFGEAFPEPEFEMVIEKTAFSLSSSGKSYMTRLTANRGRAIVYSSDFDLGACEADVLLLRGSFKKCTFTSLPTYQLQVKSIKKYC